MFKQFEIRPVVLSEIGEVTPCLTHSEALDYAEESIGYVAFGLYGMDDSGMWQHITDTTTKDAMIEMVRKLYGINLLWKHKDRIEFAREDELASVVLRRLLSVLHPGAVGLISHHHGEHARLRACSAVTEAKAYLAAA